MVETNFCDIAVNPFTQIPATGILSHIIAFTKAAAHIVACAVILILAHALFNCIVIISKFCSIPYASVIYRVAYRRILEPGRVSLIAPHMDFNTALIAAV